MEELEGTWYAVLTVFREVSKHTSETSAEFYRKCNGRKAAIVAARELLAEHAGRFNVTVTDGVVTLTGGPRTRQQGHEVVRRARHVQGVVAVRDRLDYPPPGQGAFDVVASFPVD